MESVRPSVIPVTPGGSPLAVTLKIRDSAAAPGRKKINMVIQTDTPLCVRTPTGSVELLTMNGQPLPKEIQGEPLPICPEFRIEMN